MAKMPTYDELEQEIRSLQKKSSEQKKIKAALRESEERFRELAELIQKPSMR